MTNEERFNIIMNENGFELRKAENGGYFIYDTRVDLYRPTIDEMMASEDMELGSKDAGCNLDIERGEDGICRVVYYGDNKDYAKLFNATPEERQNELADLAEKCRLDVDEIIGFMTNDHADEIIERLDTFITDGYVQDLDDMWQSSDYCTGEALTTLDDALAFEARLKSMLKQSAPTFDNIRFLQSDELYKVDLDKAYELQETDKQTEKVVPKAKQTIEKD